MSVLIEATSVVVRRATLERQYPGGVAAYERDCPNRTFCSDAHLTCVAFRSPADVGRFVHRLTMRGLRFFDGEHCVDIAVVRQDTGPVAACEWLRFDRPSDLYSCCSLAGTADRSLATPASWSPGRPVGRLLRVDRHALDARVPALS